MVIGTDAYGFIASDYHRPLVAGFEPLDLLQGAVMLVEQTIAQRSDVENQYRRVVPDAGNPLAQSAIADVFCLSGDSEWRGLGVISDSGVHLTPPISASTPKRISARRRSGSATTRAPAAARC
jgi:hydrogenase expression/formation protein HypD